MRRLGQILVSLGALLAIGSAYMHGFLARPVLIGRLPTDLAAESREALNAAWILGTVSMVAFGVLVLFGVRSLGREPGAFRVPLVAGIFFLTYGVWAFAYRHFHPHLIGFMVIGALLLVGAGIAARGRDRS